MVKTHNKTKLKYLCITKREDHLKYSGSGVRWIRHLEKHGYDYSTKIIYQSSDYSDFLEMCYHYSSEYEVAKSNQWANAIPEHGYESEEHGFTNFELFWKYADEAVKEDIIKRRNESIRDNHWCKSDRREEISKVIGAKQKEFWASKTSLEKEEMLSSCRSGFLNMVQEGGETYDNWRKSLSVAQKKYNMNGRPEEHNKTISQARLNMTQEAKDARCKKIQDVYATGKHDHLFERYSKERQGSNNPAARRVSINSVEYDSISEAIEALNMTRASISNRLNSTSERWKDWVRL